MWLQESSSGAVVLKKLGLQRSIWEIVSNGNSQGPILDLLNQKLWLVGPTNVLSSPPDAC